MCGVAWSLLTGAGIMKKSLCLFGLMAVFSTGCTVPAAHTPIGEHGREQITECRELEGCARNASEICGGAAYKVLTTDKVVREDFVFGLLALATNTEEPEGEEYLQMLFVCEEKEAEAPEVASASEQPKAQPTEPPATEPARKGPPKGAAGFSLGADPANLRAQCESMGHSYYERKTWSGCSGVATEVDLDAHATFLFCDNALCDLSLVILAEEDDDPWHLRLGLIRGRLTSLYGQPVLRNDSLLKACDANAETCVGDASLKAEYLWSWPTGHEVVLTIQPDPPRQPKAIIRYSRPKGQARGL